MNPTNYIINVWVFISALYRSFSIHCLDVWIFISALHRFFSIQYLDVWVLSLPFTGFSPFSI